MAAIFDLALIPMSPSVHTTIPAVLLDPENVGLAFGMSLILCVEAEIMRCFISTSGLWRPSLAVIFETSKERPTAVDLSAHLKFAPVSCLMESIYS